MSQAELARRAGTRQSAISAYETGRRDPSALTLERLLNAAGYDLNLEARPQGLSKSALPNTPAGRRLEENRAGIRNVAAKYGASAVYAFGSVARGDDDGDSDLDLLIDLAEPVGILTIGAIARDIERVLEVEVDLVPTSALSARSLEQLMGEAIEL